MTHYSKKPKRIKYVKVYGFMSFERILSDKYGKTLLHITNKTGPDTAKFASKRVVQKTAEATGELIGNIIVEKTPKPKSVPDENSKNVEEKAIPSGKRKKLNEIRQVL